MASTVSLFQAAVRTALFLAFSGGAALSHAATVTYSDPACDSFQLQGSGGSYTLICVPGGGGATAPSGCSVTPMTTISLGSSGGSVTLNGTCTTNVIGSTVYKWTRTGGSSGTQTYTGASVTETLPANPGTSAVTYSYTMQACNGTDCASGVVKTVTVAAGGSSGGGGDFCGQYTNVSQVNLPWNGSVRGSAGSQGVVVGKFTVPAGFSSTSYGMVTVVEYGTGAITRTVTVSPFACDFRSGTDITGATAPMISKIVSTFGEYFSTTNLGQGYPVLIPGQTYYVNVRNRDWSGANTCYSGTCDVTLTVKAPKS